MQLPAYDYPKNALINFAPISDAIDSNRKLAHDNRELDIKQQHITNERDKFGLQREQADADKAQREVHRIAGHAAVIDQMPDGPQRQAEWQKLVQGNGMGEHFSKHGIDPSDHRNGTKFLIAEAGKFDPLADKLKQAQIRNLNRREEPDIVRMVRAAGIDPRSPRGQELIAQLIKGNSPMDQVIADQMRGMAPGAQQQQQPARVQPQSNSEPPPVARLQPIADQGAAPQSDPNIIQAQAAQPQPQQQGQPDPIVQTPMGPMPSSKAKMLAFGLAYQGKGDAGKMMAPPEGSAFGKDGLNHIDKEMINRATDIGELNDIKASFKPEFLGLTGQIGNKILGWKDWITSGKISPQEQTQLREYTEFQQTTIRRYNERIKACAGTAVSGAESVRMAKESPTMDDSPNVFKAKLEKSIELQRLAIGRYNYLKFKFSASDPKNADKLVQEMAKTGNIEGAMSLDSVRKTTHRIQGEIMQGLRAANPGVPDDRLTPTAQARMTQIFGI